MSWRNVVLLSVDMQHEVIFPSPTLSILAIILVEALVVQKAGTEFWEQNTQPGAWLLLACWITLADFVVHVKGIIQGYRNPIFAVERGTVPGEQRLYSVPGLVWRMHEMGRHKRWLEWDSGACSIWGSFPGLPGQWWECSLWTHAGIQLCWEGMQSKPE